MHAVHTYWAMYVLQRQIYVFVRPSPCRYLPYWTYMQFRTIIGFQNTSVFFKNAKFNGSLQKNTVDLVRPGFHLLR